MSAFEAQVLKYLQDISARVATLEAKFREGKDSNSPISSADNKTVQNPFVKGYQEYLQQVLPPFLASCDKLGGGVQDVGKIVKELLEELGKIIDMASQCKEPNQAQFREILTPLGTKMQSMGALLKKNEWERHVKTVSEGLGCLNWVAVKPGPKDFIESFIGGSDYWANAIRKEFRTSNPDQIAFCDSFKAILTNLLAYVKQYHLPGLTWNNAKGTTIDKYQSSPVSTAAAPSSAPAVSPVKAAVANIEKGGESSSTATKGGLFAALNQEGAVTSGLKRVTKDMQTWRTEYKGGAPAPEVKKAPAATTKATVNEVKGVPKVEFQPVGSKWVVEYQNSPVEIPINDKKETVYILGCVGATINITGKCKSIVVDTCKKTSVTIDTVMASCEIVNSLRMNIHVKDMVSSVAIDKTDGIVVHLPNTSFHTDIVASKSSEMNVSFPDANGDLIERPIPEQYVHRIKGTTITADVSDLYGH